MAETTVADIVVPEIFTGYTQQLTEEKSRIVNSGIASRDATLDGFLSGAGLTFNTPSFQDLANDADNISTDAAPGVGDSTPNNIGTSTEVAVRMSRNQSWGSADLATALAGPDPLNAIAGRVADYWSRRRQAMFVATMTGLFASNDAAPAGGSTHTAGDMTNDVKGGAFVDGTTNFTATNFLATTLTMGDSMESLAAMFVHSVVYNRMQNLNLISFIPDARGETMIPVYLGRQVIIDDGMPNAAGVYETWLFGRDAIKLGVGSPKVPTAVARTEEAANGGGSEVLHNRLEWILHAVGNAYAGTPATGGPSNAGTANNLAAAASWIRVFPERKQVKIARLVTREA